MAVVGLKEDELLRGVFDTFRRLALAELQTYRNAVIATISDLAPDDRPLLDLTHDPESAVDLLVAGLTAMVRSRLLDGEQATLAAAAPRMLPARLAPPTGGDVLPGLPDPDELARASARLVRNALDVHEGRASWQMPSTPDQMPNVTFIADAQPVEERLAVSMGVQPVWTWSHGFYGEALTNLDAHVGLDGFTTNHRSTPDEPGDAELSNGESWPSYDWYFPDDHDGCTCEWVIDTEETAPARDLADYTPQYQTTTDVLARSRELVEMTSGERAHQQVLDEALSKARSRARERVLSTEERRALETERGLKFTTEDVTTESEDLPARKRRRKTQ